MSTCCKRGCCCCNKRDLTVLFGFILAAIAVAVPIVIHETVGKSICPLENKSKSLRFYRIKNMESLLSSSYASTLDITRYKRLLTTKLLLSTHTRNTSESSYIF